MDTTIPGTAWETKQHRRDHGERAAMALGLLLASKDVREDGSGLIPPPFTIYYPASGDDAAAQVDAWAKAHGVTAAPDLKRGTYEAKVTLGPVTLMAYHLLPDRAADMPAPAELAGVAA